MTMTRRLQVNRQPELALFEDVLDPRAEKRILFLQAPSGFGKSLLLEQYLARLQAESLPWALIDFKGKGIGPIEFLSRLRDDWGSAHFPRFAQTLAQGPAVSLADARQFGLGQSLEVHVGEGAGQRRERIIALTTAWIEDCQAWLAQAGRAVIVVDTYDPVATTEGPVRVDPELQTWLEVTFLPHVRRTPGLRLILAGKQPPENNIAWEFCCRRHTLGPISDPRDWMALVDALRIRASLEVVSAYCHSEKGHPVSIATRLSALIDWRLE